MLLVFNLVLLSPSLLTILVHAQDLLPAKHHNAADEQRAMRM